ncbi:MAG: UDP-N-acetylmuramate dehydrogenase [Flavobacteriaceae bacterium]
MQVYHNFSLKEYNTFGMDAKARLFIEVNDIGELKETLSQYHSQNPFLLGGGSNMLLTRDMDVPVIHLNFKGIRTVLEEGDTVEIEVMAGENWHETVLHTLEQGYGGLENLSLIPGNVGTAPIQNIGAYGVELKDVFVQCKAIGITDQRETTFTKEACQFGYRDSIFKNTVKDQYAIVSLRLRLTKSNHKLNTSYGAIEDELHKNGITNPTPKDVSKAVIAIRQRKLPDPALLGNSGSFFKNPVLDSVSFGHFSKNHPEAPFYKVSDSAVKIPAGWLIEQCGFKGIRHGDAGVHDKQALVLVNHGNASGKDVLKLAQLIMETVKNKFNIELRPEVNIIS